MRAFILFIALSLAISASYATSIRNIVSQKGQPTILTKSTDGTMDYVYIDQVQNPRNYETKVFVAPGGQAYGINVPSPMPPTYRVQCTTHYRVDRQGNVIGARYSGDC